MSDLLQQIKARAVTIPEHRGQLMVPLSDLETILEGMVVIKREALEAIAAAATLGANGSALAALGACSAIEHVAYAALPQPTLAPDGDGGDIE